MATLTSQVKLNISGVTSDPIAVDKSFTYTALSGGITSRSIDDTSAAGEKILEADEYATGCIVYLRNREAAGGKTITIQLSAAAAGEIILQGQEWAVFPWTGAVDVLAFASAATPGPILEIGIFSAA
tara:strand:+ start:125 stop:505 length:381 start_codon:yes stop_codon:yes gene_type:complete